MVFPIWDIINVKIKLLDKKK